MPLRYCNLHERVFAEREHKWIDFSRYKMKLLKNFFDLHYALGYEIVEASCDQCDEIARQMLQKLFDASEL